MQACKSKPPRAAITPDTEINVWPLTGLARAQVTLVVFQVEMCGATCLRWWGGVGGSWGSALSLVTFFSRFFVAHRAFTIAGIR